MTESPKKHRFEIELAGAELTLQISNLFAAAKALGEDALTDSATKLGIDVKELKDLLDSDGNVMTVSVGKVLKAFGYETKIVAHNASGAELKVHSRRERTQKKPNLLNLWPNSESNVTAKVTRTYANIDGVSNTTDIIQLPRRQANSQIVDISISEVKPEWTPSKGSISDQNRLNLADTWKALSNAKS